MLSFFNFNLNLISCVGVGFVYLNLNSKCRKKYFEKNFYFYSGVSQSIWDDDDSAELDAYMPGNDDDIDTRIPEFDTEPEISEQNTLLKLLKRASLLVPEGYRRTSRPNRFIIPFYSYGHDSRNYRSRPVAPYWKQSVSYDQSPWNSGHGRHAADRFRARRYSIYK